LKSASDHRAFRNRLLKELEGAQSVHEVLGLIQHWEEACRLMMSSASKGRQYLLLEDLAAALRSDLSKRVALPEAAERVGMSTSHFSRAFRKKFGSSFAHWMLRQRCEEACRVLKVSSLAIQQVSDACGFS